MLGHNKVSIMANAIFFDLKTVNLKLWLLRY